MFSSPICKAHPAPLTHFLQSAALDEMRSLQSRTPTDYLYTDSNYNQTNTGEQSDPEQPFKPEFVSLCIYYGVKHYFIKAVGCFQWWLVKKKKFNAGVFKKKSVGRHRLLSLSSGLISGAGSDQVTVHRHLTVFHVTHLASEVSESGLKLDLSLVSSSQNNSHHARHLRGVRGITPDKSSWIQISWEIWWVLLNHHCWFCFNHEFIQNQSKLADLFSA